MSGAAVERGAYLFINPDLSIYLHRPAQGEWVALLGPNAYDGQPFDSDFFPLMWAE